MASNNLLLKYNFGVFKLAEWSRQWQNSEKKYEFRTYGIRLDVRIRFELFDELKVFQALKDQIYLDTEMTVIEKITPTVCLVRFIEVFADCQFFVSSATS